ncbi:glycosyltransferase [Dermatobacter hominis]|uniref:glycosyltransferase n=1 Tax=Dermatobacter hominis TaxID=2884263 RepID=UPI001D11216D|nr:glycosyltransferase [Dermatobacter hominis]UDY37679.1 glycosyltransferase [Dermatobacter hominis]
MDGYRQRLHHIIGGLTQAGPVDVVAPLRPGMPDPVQPPWPGVARTLTEPIGDPAGPKEWLPDWLGADVPRRLLSLDWSALVASLAIWRDRYDLVWYSHVDAWSPTHDLFGGTPAIVDFDNLENLSMRLRRRIPPRIDPGDGPKGRAAALARWATSRGFDVVDERRWDAVQRRVAADVDHVVVCSELDVARSGCANAVVVPNGAEPPVEVRSDRTELRGDVPVLLFVGALDYEPNTEAMSWFLREVWPIVRAGRPDVVVHVVGRGAEALGSEAHAEGVELLGTVADLQAELDRADVSIVPIRVGAGTRLKVIEALANHLPIVTTTVGSEGIAVEDGRTALMADDATTFAGAVLRLVADGELRQHLADEGRVLFDEHYTWAGIRDDVERLARDTVAAAASTTSG